MLRNINCLLNMHVTISSRTEICVKTNHAFTRHSHTIQSITTLTRPLQDFIVPRQHIGKTIHIEGSHSQRIKF